MAMIVCSYSLLVDKISQPFGGYRIQHGHLNQPTGVCLDSTNTVYVTDSNNRVSVCSSGQLIKCFSNFGLPKGVAVDNTTGALYVCDFNNHRVVVY